MKKSPVTSVRLNGIFFSRWFVMGWVSSLVAASALGQETSDTAVPPRQFQVIATHQLVKTDRTITYNKVVPPALAPLPAPPTVAVPPPTDAEIAAANAKRYVMLTLSFIPLDDHVAQLSWLDEEDRPHRVFTNVDFGDFPGYFSYSFNGTYYSVMFMLGIVPKLAATGDELAPAKILAEAKTRLAAVKSYSYVPATTAEGSLSATDTETLDLLHSYYTVYREQLRIDKARREAEAEEFRREEERKARLPVVINYWKKALPAATP